MLADSVEASVRSLSAPDEAHDPGDGRSHHRRAPRGRPVRRVRPDAARPRADPRGVRGAAAGHVPPAHRVPAEQDRRARVAPRGDGGRRGRRDPRGSIYVGRGASTSRSARVSRRRCAAAAIARTSPPERWTRPARRRPRSIGLILTDDASWPSSTQSTWARRPDRRPVVPAAAAVGLSAAPGQRAGIRTRQDRRLRPAARAAVTHLGDIVVSVERAVDQAQPGRGGQTGDVRWSRRTSCASS